MPETPNADTPNALNPATGDGPWLQTPSQTVGPFFGYALPYPGDAELMPAWRAGAIRFHGTVYDGEGAGIPDAIIEIWQADADGRPVDRRGSLNRDGHTFTGFGRAPADRDGHYSFSTMKPGASRPDAAPRILVAVFARGLLRHLFTRAYFSDEADANERDAFLADVDASRRQTLIAQRDAAGYRFDIRLQGEDETVFLDFDEPADMQQARPADGER